MPTTTITEIIQAGQQVSFLRHYRLEATGEPDIYLIIAIDTTERILGRKRWAINTIGAQQGDVYLTRLAAVPSGAQRLLKTDGQLVPGHTQGSRHCVDPGQVRLWAFANPTALQGPIIEAPEVFTVRHPEHGHLTFPAGVYGVTYQRQYADTVRRVMD